MPSVTDVKWCNNYDVLQCDLLECPTSQWVFPQCYLQQYHISQFHSSFSKRFVVIFVCVASTHSLTPSRSRTLNCAITWETCLWKYHPLPGVQYYPLPEVQSKSVPASPPVLSLIQSFVWLAESPESRAVKYFLLLNLEQVKT